MRLPEEEEQEEEEEAKEEEEEEEAEPLQIAGAINSPNNPPAPVVIPKRTRTQPVSTPSKKPKTK